MLVKRAVLGWFWPRKNMEAWEHLENVILPYVAALI
jgi:hypothetical protein